MQLSKPIAILVLLATTVPLLYLLFFMGMIFVAIVNVPGPNGNPLPIDFRVLFALHFLCILWIWGLIAFYVVYLFKTDFVAKDQKALWAVILFVGNVIAMPIFWYLYLWSPLRAGANSGPPT